MKSREYDYRKLRGRIKEKLGTEGKFAEEMGRSQAYIVNVLNNRSYLTQADIDKALEILNIPVSEIGLYFFTPLVHSKGTNVDSAE